MRTNLKQMIIVRAAVALLGTGSVFASLPAPSPEASETDALAYLSRRASTLFAEIKKEAALPSCSRYVTLCFPAGTSHYRRDFSRGGTSRL